MEYTCHLFAFFQMKETTDWSSHRYFTLIVHLSEEYSVPKRHRPWQQSLTVIQIAFLVIFFSSNLAIM